MVTGIYFPNATMISARAYTANSTFCTEETAKRVAAVIDMPAAGARTPRSMQDRVLMALNEGM